MKNNKDFEEKTPSEKLPDFHFRQLYIINTQEFLNGLKELIGDMMNAEVFKVKGKNMLFVRFCQGEVFALKVKKIK